MALRLCASSYYGNIVKLVRGNAVLSFQRESSSNKTSNEDKVVITDDGTTIVCWHPEKPFPYECSRPLPQIVEEEVDGVLKVKNVSPVILSKQTNEAVRQELMKITHTTKHKWFPRARDKYYRKFEKDREYL